MLFDLVESIIEKVDWEDASINVDMAWRKVDELFGTDTYPNP